MVHQAQPHNSRLDCMAQRKRRRQRTGVYNCATACTCCIPQRCARNQPLKLLCRAPRHHTKCIGTQMSLAAAPCFERRYRRSAVRHSCSGEGHMQPGIIGIQVPTYPARLIRPHHQALSPGMDTPAAICACSLSRSLRLGSISASAASRTASLVLVFSIRQATRPLFLSTA